MRNCAQIGQRVVLAGDCCGGIELGWRGAGGQRVQQRHAMRVLMRVHPSGSAKLTFGATRLTPGNVRTELMQQRHLKPMHPHDRLAWSSTHVSARSADGSCRIFASVVRQSDHCANGVHHHRKLSPPVLRSSPLFRCEVRTVEYLVRM